MLFAHLSPSGRDHNDIGPFNTFPELFEAQFKADQKCVFDTIDLEGFDLLLFAGLQVEVFISKLEEFDLVLTMDDPVSVDDHCLVDELISLFEDQCQHQDLFVDLFFECLERIGREHCRGLKVIVVIGGQTDLGGNNDLFVMVFSNETDEPVKILLIAFVTGKLEDNRLHGLWGSVQHICLLKVIQIETSFGIVGHIPFKEVRFLVIELGEILHPLDRMLYIIELLKTDCMQSLIRKVFDVLFDDLIGKSQDLPLCDIGTPGRFEFDRIPEHLVDIVDQLFGEEFGAFSFRCIDHVLEEQQVGHFISLDKTDHLCGSEHFVRTCQCIEVGETTVEVDPFEDLVGEHRFDDILIGRIGGELFVDLCDGIVLGFEFHVPSPELIDLLGVCRDTVHHDRIALGVQRLFKCLSDQNEVDLRSGNERVEVVNDIVRLQGIHEDELGEYFVVCLLFRICQLFIVIDISRHIDLFGKPGIVKHHLPEIVRPLVFDIIQLKDTGRITTEDLAVAGPLLRIGIIYLFT